MVLRILYFFPFENSSASSLLLLRCNFHINSIFFISQWTYKNMQNVLKFPIWWWFHVTKKSPNYNLHWKHQTMLIFLDSSTLLPGYKRGDVMKSIVCIFFNTYIDILKKEEKTRCAKRAEISNLTSSLNYNLHRMKHQSQTQCYILTPFSSNYNSVG